MTRWALVSRSLVHYWRTNVAVVAGVATAVSVLSGALVVGDSVRGTLRDLAFQRLGATDLVLSSAGFFREALAHELSTDAAFSAGFSRLAPLVVAQATVSVQGEGGRAGNVAVYGIDRRFWQFHGLADEVEGPVDREAFISSALARDTGLEIGGIALVRLERPSEVPLESLHGQKENLGQTVRLTVRRILPAEALGEFSLQMQQGDVRAVFVPIERLQADLEVGARVNAIVVAASTVAGDKAALERIVRAHVTLDDFGLRIGRLDRRRAVVVDAEAGVLEPDDAAAVTRALEGTGLTARPVLTYLANTIRVGAREVPYSLVTAIDLSAVVPEGPRPTAATPPIVLNTWAAADLGARIGDPVTLEYYRWEDPGRLVTRSAQFQLAAIVPVNDADRDLAPTYPGITDSPTLDAWDPPFPLNLRRVRPKDEAYWQAHRTTPKGYIPIEVGQALWSSRFGRMTSLQVLVPADRSLDVVADELSNRVRQHIDPFAAGMAVGDVRADATRASTGATDFGEDFLYFSFFLVVSALLLAALFFKLGVEQRAREVGLLRAVGMDTGGVRRLFLTEAFFVALFGGLIGLGGAVGYAWVVVAGLRTWWVDAVGTTSLAVHVAPVSLFAGALGAIGAAFVCTAWTLRSLGRISERSLLAGDVTTADARGVAPRSMLLASAAGTLVVGVSLLGAAWAGVVPGAGGFFGAGTALLMSALCLYAWLSRSPSRRLMQGRGVGALARLGLRNASARPARSVLSIAVIAAATFILISVDAFRREAPDPNNPLSGVGGYALIVETLLPIVHDVTTSAGREALNLSNVESPSIQPFRLRPGDDASCLNLYRPQNPRILGARPDFIRARRFAFQKTLASTDDERANPWLLLEREEPDGAVPVIADADSMAYVLHRSVGEDFVIEHGGREVRLRFVAALADSVFQRELVMAESRFLELFPDREGYRVLLVESPPDRASQMATTLEDALADFGADVSTTTGRLAAFHKVENTYLSTFQTLGGLGLLLGTVGLAAVLLRNVLERRRELALLGAVGYRRGHFIVLLMSESVSLLVAGLLAGGVSAGLAIWPALAARGGVFPLSGSGALLLFVVCVGGVIATMAAAWVATSTPLLPALRSE